MAQDTRSRPRGGEKSSNLSANQELKKVLNLQIVATHYQASFPYLEGAVGATAGASLLTARACKQSWRGGSSDGFTDSRTSDQCRKVVSLFPFFFIHTE